MHKDELIENHVIYEWLSPELAREKPCVFIDRDGVINHRVIDGYVLDPSQLEYLEGNVRVLSRLAESGIPLVIVSNQSCVGRGLLPPATLREIMHHVVERMQHAGVAVSGWFCCPHEPREGCGCRKPGGGLLFAASATNRVDLSRSVMIGDQPSDVDAGNVAGCAASYLVPEGRSDLLEQCVGRVLSLWRQ